MKYRLYHHPKTCLLTCIIWILCCFTLESLAQKRPLDHSVYDKWQSIGSPLVSNNGNVVVYTVSPQEGDTLLYIHTGKKSKPIKVERGKRPHITWDSRYVVCVVKAPFATRRKARIKKWKNDKFPKDSIAVVNVYTGKIKKYPFASDFKIGARSIETFAFLSSDTTIIAKKERNKKDIGKPMLVCRLNGLAADTLNHVSSFVSDRFGHYFAYVGKTAKLKQWIGIFDTKTGRNVMVTDTVPFCSKPVFSYDGSKLLFLTSKDTLSTGSKHCELWEYKTGDVNARKLAGSDAVADVPAGWGLTENASPYYSRDGKRIFAGVAPFIAPKDSNIVDFESASLDIWNYDAPELPPMLKANKASVIRRTVPAILRNGRLHALTTSMFDKISLASYGDSPWALSTDETTAVLPSQWDIQMPLKLSLINITTGKRYLIDSARVEYARLSPGGKSVVWYDLQKRQWMCHDIASGRKFSLTDGLTQNFWNEENDMPMLPESYGLVGFTDNDRDVIVYDRYDLWRLPLSGGKPVCITGGEGRRQGRVYRYLNTKDAEDDSFIKYDEKMLLSVFDEKTKMNGVAEITPSSEHSEMLITPAGYSYAAVKKARFKDIYLYERGNFQEPMDLYLTSGKWKSNRKLTAINPQQKDYNWGTVELHHWTAYDGTRLDGLLYKPEDFDSTKKYPMMVYFYEKRSETLYDYITPQPSWSTINITFYTSRGYLVFVPDIVYKAGIPGECAYNCICSGVESIMKHPWVDRDRIAIQGQSWGGYQVAYLITRTNMFRAAGAGAPVANMTSAYGGIRWQTGMSRQFQYEQTQSRIGRTLWQAPELYISNSPLFKLPQVNTPVLIMHNDADGAVPWYQGIEMFMGLRRLGKPAWLLEYNNEAHNLKQRRNRKDLSIRLQQFFDYELKDAPEPAWMKRQLPIETKGSYFGYETE